jgi:hypothetical protein
LINVLQRVERSEISQLDAIKLLGDIKFYQIETLQGQGYKGNIITTDVVPDFREMTNDELRKMIESGNAKGRINEIDGLIEEYQEVVDRREKELVELEDVNEEDNQVLAANNSMQRKKRQISGLLDERQDAVDLAQRFFDITPVDESSTKTSKITTDKASLDKPDKVGGINLNPSMLDLQIRRDGQGIPLPISQQPIGNMQIDGFIPVIINVTPITNLPLLLGVSTEEQTNPINSAKGATQKYKSLALKKRNQILL